MRRLKLLTLAAVTAFGLAACDDGDDSISVITGTISGSVTIEGSGASGISVALSDGSSTSTSSSGGYTFAAVAAGAYTVSISGIPSDATFASTAKTAVISTANQTVTVNFDGSFVRTASIVGSVTADGQGLTGIAVSLSGTSPGSTSTDSNGQYALTGLLAGSYTVAISGFDASDFSFSSVSQTTSVSAGGSSVVSFAGSENASGTITATVTKDGSGLSGVTVSIAGGASTTTGSNGTATFSGLARGDYAVSITNPDPANVSFASTTAAVSITTIGGSAAASFVGSTIANGSISGTVSLSGAGWAAFTVSISGVGDVTTDASGVYSATGLTAGTYTVSVVNPDPTAFTFDRESASVTITSQGSATVDFNATPRNDNSVSGRVWIDDGDGAFTANDTGIANVGISMNGASTTTGSDGSYSFADVVSGTYTVSCDDCAALTTASFNQTSASVTLSGADNETVNFWAVTSATGSIAASVTIDGAAASGVSVTLTGASGATQSTGSDGSTTFSGLATGTYSVSVSNTADVTYASTTSSVTIATLDGTGSASFAGSTVETASITGTVMAGGLGLNAVAVTLSGAETGSTTTDATGAYSFGNLRSGTYTVTIAPSATLYSFDVTSQSVTVSVTGDAGVVNFSGDEQSTASVTANVTLDGAAQAGVPVALTGATSRAGTTGADGAAAFTGLPRGDYTVSITNTDAGNVEYDQMSAAVSIADIGGSGSAAFAGTTVAEGVISGTVTVDGAGIAATVTIGANSTATAADGSYSFTGMAAGDYTVSITFDEDLWNFATTSQAVVGLTKRGTRTVNFDGEVNRDGSISGRVWFDNGDNVYTSADTDVVGATVSLDSGESTTTAADGTYSITNLTMGTYVVSCSGGECDGFTSSGTPATLASGSEAATVMFWSGADTGNGSISGQVFIDAQLVGQPGRGTYDPNVDETSGFGSIVVTIEGPEIGNNSHNTTTAADGSYSATDLPPGDYTVTLGAVSGSLDLITNGGVATRTLNLTAGENETSEDFGFEINSFIVQVPVVLGADGGNEVAAAGVTVHLYADQSLGTVLPTGSVGAVTDAAGIASFTFPRAQETTEFGGAGDFVVFAQITDPGDVAVNQDIIDDATIEIDMSLTEFTQTATEDHNIIFNNIVVTATYVERSGAAVSDANVAALALSASLGWGALADLTDRVAIGPTDTPNDDFRVGILGAEASVEADGVVTFFINQPQVAAGLPQVLSITDVSGSAQIEVGETGVADDFIQVTVDGTAAAVDMGTLLITYPLPDITGQIWHEVDDDVGFDAVDDDFLNMALIGVDAMYDDDADGVADVHACVVTAGTGSFTCADVPAVENADPVGVSFRAITANVNTRIIEGGSAVWTSVDQATPKDGREVWVNVTSIVDDATLTEDLGDEPFSYKFEGNTLTFDVFNETGAAQDADHIADGSEDAVEGVTTQLTVTKSLGTFAGEFDAVTATTVAGTGTATYTDVLEGEYQIQVTGVDAAFTAGIANIKMIDRAAVEYEGAAISTVPAFPVELERTGPAAAADTDEIEAQFKGGIISGYIFDNDDDDATADPSEVVNSIAVTATPAGTGTGGTSVTASGGLYSFTDLWEDTYTIAVTASPNLFTGSPATRAIPLGETDEIGGVLDEGTANNGGTTLLDFAATPFNLTTTDGSDTDIELVYENTTLTVTVTADGANAGSSITVRFYTCDAATSTEGATSAAGVCGGGGTLIDTPETDANGQVAFPAALTATPNSLPEGFYWLDVVELDAAAGAVAVEDGWVVRMLGQNDAETRIVDINVP